MNEQNDHIWMHKKPETVFDWLAIIAISIALYLMLGHLNVFAGGIAKFLDVVAPFASGIVIAYVLDCTCRCTYPMCRTCWICCKTVMALI